MNKVFAVPAALAVALLGLPLVALLWRTPWAAIPALLTREETLQALGTSFGCAAVATVLCVVLGVPLAAATARRTGPATSKGAASAIRAVVTGLVTVPVVLPPVVAGVALLYLVGRRGLLGQVLYEVTGTTIAFTPAAVVLAQTFVALPFLVLSVRSAIESLDPDLADAAATMGANHWQTVRHVVLPMVGPAVVTGAVLSFARALGEFGATITVAGAIPGVTRTVPTAIYSAMQSDPDTGAALAIVMLAVSLPLLAGTATLKR